VEIKAFKYDIKAGLEAAVRAHVVSVNISQYGYHCIQWQWRHL
jgi:hypothetical protein